MKFIASINPALLKGVNPKRVRKVVKKGISGSSTVRVFLVSKGFIIFVDNYRDVETIKDIVYESLLGLFDPQFFSDVEVEIDYDDEEDGEV